VVLFANMGVPMLAVYWPVAWFALIPIVLIEVWVGIRLLKSTFRTLLPAAAWGNLVSTLVGIPVAWFALAATQAGFFDRMLPTDSLAGKFYAAVLQAPWLNPHNGQMYWMVPTAAVVLTIPFYLISVAIEAMVARWTLPAELRAQTYRWMWRANAASYLFLCVAVCVLCACKSWG